MIFYILLNHITTLFVSLGLLTTLTFDSEITSYLYGGSNEDLFIKVANNRKTLAIKPKRAGIKSNLLVMTKDRKFYFNVRFNDKQPHEFIEVKSAQINHAMRKRLETREYRIMEGSTSIAVINKKSSPLRVNGKQISKKGYFSKGVPLFINSKRILN
jgi:type IV secretory pathway VirB9-like protein